jgi:hypothetical protein
MNSVFGGSFTVLLLIADSRDRDSIANYDLRLIVGILVLITSRTDKESQ